MQFLLESPDLVSLSKFNNIDLLILGVFQEDSLSDIFCKRIPDFPQSLAEELITFAALENFKGKNKETVKFFVQEKYKLPIKRVILLGLGKGSEFEQNNIRKQAATLARQFARKENHSCIAVDMRFEGEALFLQSFVEGWLLASYNFSNYKSQKDDPNEFILKTKQIIFLDNILDKETFLRVSTQGKIIAESTNYARDLVAEPACEMTPTKLSEIALSLANENIECVIHSHEDIVKFGMGAFLGVAQGSKEEEKLIVLNYKHSAAKKKIAIVGKGITFDSGGLSLKTASGMETMKCDMSGGAAVLGIIKAASELNLPINIIACIPACENMPSGTALKPGDIVRSMKGKTIEVNNTDAEGRLALADGIAFVCNEKPDVLIDIATLTGAIITALGRVAAGIMGNDEKLQKQIIECGQKAGERYWSLPLFDDYKESLKSDIADLKNAGSRGEAGSSSAGMFLQEFVECSSWAHLDIAGTAWLEKEKDELCKGGTAFGVRSLLYYLMEESLK